MTETEIWETLGEILREHLKLEGPFAPELDLDTDLELDSIQRLTLVVEIENRFRIVLDPSDEETVRSLGDVAALVRRRLAASAASGASE